MRFHFLVISLGLLAFAPALAWADVDVANFGAIANDDREDTVQIQLAVSGNDPQRRWIDYYASDEIRTLTIDGIRASPEGGGIPLVHCFARPRTDFAAAAAGTPGIFIRQSTIFSGGSMIVLHEVPNLISIENTSGGVCYDHIIIAAKGAKLPDAKLQKMFKFRIDSLSRLPLTGAGRFEPSAPELSQYWLEGQ